MAGYEIDITPATAVLTDGIAGWRPLTDETTSETISGGDDPTFNDPDEWSFENDVDARPIHHGSRGEVACSRCKDRAAHHDFLCCSDDHGLIRCDRL